MTNPTETKIQGHTAGPWTYNGHAAVWLDKPGHYDDSYIICTTQIKGEHAQQMPDAATRQANAKLIAAAPELLEACKLAWELYEHAEPTCCDEFVVASLAKIKAAIRKATAQA